MNRQSTRRLTQASLALCLATLLGCGGSSGPPRYTVSGKAVFGGRPITFGTISFTPDTSRGNSGPGSFAQIRDGSYSTPRGQGTVGGPHVLTITGFDRLPGSGAPGEQITPLFSSYPLTVDLPREDTTYDIDVPASAADSTKTMPASRPR
jgi:hypothetical protein